MNSPSPTSWNTPPRPGPSWTTSSIRDGPSDPDPYTSTYPHPHPHPHLHPDRSPPLDQPHDDRLRKRRRTMAGDEAERSSAHTPRRRSDASYAVERDGPGPGSGSGSGSGPNVWHPTKSSRSNKMSFLIDPQTAPPTPTSSQTGPSVASLPPSAIRLIAFHLMYERSNLLFIPSSREPPAPVHGYALGSSMTTDSARPRTRTGTGYFSSSSERETQRERTGSIWTGRSDDTGVFVPNGGVVLRMMLVCRAFYEALSSERGLAVGYGSNGQEVAKLCGTGSNEHSAGRSGAISSIAAKRKRSRSFERERHRDVRRSNQLEDEDGDEDEPKDQPHSAGPSRPQAHSIDPALLEPGMDPSFSPRPTSRSRPRFLPSEDLAMTADHLYRHLYFETFDTEAVVRRYRDREAVPSAQGRYRAQRRWERIRRERERDQDSMEPLSAGWDDQARFDEEEFDLVGQPRYLAREYKERMALFRRMRYVVAFKELDVVVLRKGGEGEGSSELGFRFDGMDSGQVGEVVCRRQDLEEDLWRIWWMITENDTRNIDLLHSLGSIVEYLIVIYHRVLMADFKEPDYPKDSVERGLYSWICVRLGVDTGLEMSPENLDEKVFLHKPFALACFKYPNLLGPWLFRHLPLVDVARSHEELDLISGPNPFMSELSPKAMASTVVRFGREWGMVAPRHTEATVFMLARVLDRHPSLGTLRKAANPELTRIKPRVDMPRDLQLTVKSSPSTESRPRGNSLIEGGVAKAIISVDYDQEVKRSLSCLSPVDSPGLPPLFFRNKLHGLWVGKYLAMDHLDYKRALLGDIRSLYEGPFGDQQQESFLEESVINVRIDRVGGDGPALAAGFKVDMDDDELREDLEMDADQRGWEPCLDEEAPDKPGWTKELILQGKGQSPWGPCHIYGRVRNWDGLISWRTDYGPLAVDKWLWRGYVHAGGVMLGRFRDIFTPENVRAYEGPFAMFKVDSALHGERQRERLSTSHQRYRTPGPHSDYEVTFRVPPPPPRALSNHPTQWEEQRPTLPPISHITQHHMSSPAEPPPPLPSMRTLLDRYQPPRFSDMSGR